MKTEMITEQMSWTSLEIALFRTYDAEGKHARAILHLNAAAVFAGWERPEAVAEIRKTIDTYKSIYLKKGKPQ